MGRVGFDKKKNIKPKEEHTTELWAEDINEMIDAIHDNDDQLQQKISKNAGGSETKFWNEKGELVDISSIVSKYNKIYINGYEAQYIAVNGSLNNISLGDLAINRKISETKFATVSVFIGGNPLEGNSWEIKSGIINIGPTENE